MKRDTSSKWGRVSRDHLTPEVASADPENHCRSKRYRFETRKLWELVADPNGVTTVIGPFFAPLGTVALI